MPLRRRNVVFVIAAAVMALLFIRLGVWQLQRLADRRARNAVVLAHLAAAPVPLAALPRDSAQRHYRRARFAGTYDFAHQILLIDRVRDGAPGVQLFTPLRPDSGLGDSVVLVDRGWVYAPDGMSVNPALWREPVHAEGVGYIGALEIGRGPAASTTPGEANRFRWLDRRAIERLIGQPVVDYDIIVQPETPAPSAPSQPPVTAAAAASPLTPRPPARVPPPTLDDGPHLNYAIQWFSFAVIAIVGPILALSRKGRADQWQPGRVA